MGMISNLKIRTKLIILIAIMLIGIFVVGAIGNMNSMNSEKVLSDFYNDNLVAVKILNDISIQSHRNYANVLKLVYSDDNGSKQSALRDIANCNSKIENDIKDYKNTTFDDYEKKNFETFQKDLAGWQDFLTKATDLAKSGKYDEALELYQSGGDLVFKGFDSTINDLVGYNNSHADQIYRTSADTARRATLILDIVVGAVSLISIILCVMITLTITKPISRVVALVNRTAHFDLVFDKSFDKMLKRKDEMGLISKAVSDMRDSLRNTIGSLYSISNSLAANSRELNASTDENTKTINQVVNAINEIAQGNNNQADAVNKASHTISVITGQIDEVDKATVQSVEAAKKSLELVSEGQNAVLVTTGKMQENVQVSGLVNTSLAELTESISRVGNISDLINSISAQTNLLALNAAIEAARAGEAGKGFAVVAEEIRKLAEESSSAAKQIAVIVKDTIEKNAAATENIDKAKEIIGEQTEAVNVTREAFNNIQLSVQGISEDIERAAGMLGSIEKASKDILSQTHDMAALAEQSAAGSQEISASSQEQLASVELISKAAGDLSEMANDLKNAISAFKL